MIRIFKLCIGVDFNARTRDFSGSNVFCLIDVEILKNWVDVFSILSLRISAFEFFIEWEKDTKENT